MNSSGVNFPLDRRPLNQRWLWCALGILALAFHYALSPFLFFPFLFLIPIMLAAWHAGPTFAVGLAVVLSLIRFGFNFLWFLWSPPWTFLDAVLIALFRGGVLVVVALLTARVASLHRALLHRVKTLEGLLPICSHCKRIRDEHEEWKPLETYISARSEAKFSHSICPECMKEFYSELFSKSGNT